jgi:hypothetical protein
MPSHGGESKGSDGIDGAVEEDVHFSEEVLSAAINFCSSPAFEDPITAFKDQHLHVFAEYCGDISEGKRQEEEGALAEEVEQSLACSEVFEDYQSLVEALLQGCVTRHGSSAQEFFCECADAVEGKFVPLFEEHENKW